MSVIACEILNNGYRIAADSISIRHWTQTKAGEHTKIAKLFEVNNIVIGGCGLISEIGLMQIFLNTHQPDSPTEKALLEFLFEFANWKNDKTATFDIENEYIIGVDKKVFVVYQWMINEILTYEAIGAGMDYALSALYLDKTAEQAVQTAIDLCVYCEGPIKVIEK